MGVGSSKKREEEKKKMEEEKRRKEAEEKLENARKDLQLKIDDLEQKVEVFQKKANNLHEKAKEKLANGDRNGAKKLLHKKKKVTEQIENINNALIMLDDQLFTIENQEILGGITSAVKKGVEAIKAESAGLGVEKVEDLYNSLNDIKEKTKEVGEFLKDINEDDIDVDEDFEELEKGIMEEDSKEFPGANKEKLEKKKMKNNLNNMIEA